MINYLLTVPTGISRRLGQVLILFKVKFKYQIQNARLIGVYGQRHGLNLILELVSVIFSIRYPKTSPIY